MTDRKYSLAEIDKMRFAVRKMSTGNGTYMARELDENVLRTYLMAGADPDELLAQAKVVYRKWETEPDDDDEPSSSRITEAQADEAFERALKRARERWGF